MRFIALALAVLALTGCGRNAEQPAATDSTAAAAVSATDTRREPVYVDVRTQEEYDAGHVKGAILIPHDQLQARISELAPYRDREVVLYCKSGRRAGLAEQVLKQAGFTSVRNAGGFDDVKQAGAATEGEKTTP